ncbi:hypothetical protein SAMD00079811_35870 [Scytonema sp. HK-05]|nr:hypothetical protein SAMD00079811_35870 [Scytonema sp. HK-05]
MVIFDVPPGGRDNYKIWEEGQPLSPYGHAPRTRVRALCAYGEVTHSRIQK